VDKETKKEFKWGSYYYFLKSKSTYLQNIAEYNPKAVNNNSMNLKSALEKQNTMFSYSSLKSIKLIQRFDHIFNQWRTFEDENINQNNLIISDQPTPFIVPQVRLNSIHKGRDSYGVNVRL
jgi:hypothetical protein